MKRINKLLELLNEKEIEEWMVDLSYWNVLAKEKTVAVKSSKPDEEFSNTLSEYKVTVALQEEPEPEMEIEDWMLDIDEFIQKTNFAKR
jgi:hypothetical protein